MENFLTVKLFGRRKCQSNDLDLVIQKPETIGAKSRNLNLNNLESFKLKR